MTDYVDNISKLEALVPTTELYVTVLGYHEHEPGDGGGGSFYWDNSYVGKGDKGLIILSKVLDPSIKGGWRRIYNEPISVKWFGARGKGSSLPTDIV